MSVSSKKALVDYEIISKVGGGGFGSVFKGRAKRGGQIVAIKAVRLQTEAGDQRDAIPSFAQREIQVLKRFGGHPNSPICSLLCEPIHDRSERLLYLVFKYYPYDLNALLLMEPLTFDQVRFYLHRLLVGLQMLHKANYVHRDIKPENILIDVNHNLALTDFGLAREVTGTLTTRVGTQYYRAPEQLLGGNRYGPPVDIWAVGCLMSVMLTGKCLFEGHSDSNQLDRICRMKGTPTVPDWPGMAQLPNAKIFMPTRPIRRDFKKVMVDRLRKWPQTVSSGYIDLMLQMLEWDPERRITAEKALTLPLFLGVESVVEKLPSLKGREAHQKKETSKVLCDFLIEGLDLDIEVGLPRQCVV
jgi:serine/threonine protein kinase